MFFNLKQSEVTQCVENEFANINVATNLNFELFEDLPPPPHFSWHSTTEIPLDIEHMCFLLLSK